MKADINDELEKLERLEQEFFKVEKMIDLPAEEVSYINRGAMLAQRPAKAHEIGNIWF